MPRVFTCHWLYKLRRRCSYETTELSLGTNNLAIKTLIEAFSIYFAEVQILDAKPTLLKFDFYWRGKGGQEIMDHLWKKIILNPSSPHLQSSWQVFLNCMMETWLNEVTTSEYLPFLLQRHGKALRALMPSCWMLVIPPLATGASNS